MGVADKLDPFQAYLPYRLYRESSRYVKGKIVKVSERATVRPSLLRVNRRIEIFSLTSSRSILFLSNRISLISIVISRK